MPRRTKDPAILSELDREEQQFKDRRAAERKNSKRVALLVRGPAYLALLKLSEKFGREPKIQAELCLELGVRFYENDNTPYGGPRPLEHLPEVREGTVIETGDAPLHRAPLKGNGWMGEDAGLPIVSGPVWSAPPSAEPEVEVAPIQESSPEPPPSEPAFPVKQPETPSDEDIEVTV